MNEQSFLRARQRATDTTALSAVAASELEAINGGSSAYGFLGCGGREDCLNPQPLPPSHDRE